MPTDSAALLEAGVAGSITLFLGGGLVLRLGRLFGGVHRSRRHHEGLPAAGSISRHRHPNMTASAPRWSYGPRSSRRC